MATTKPNTLDTGKTASDNVVLKCGDCLHFCGSPHPSIGQACELRGVKRFATAPNCYTANVHVFRKTSSLTLHVLANAISGFSPSQTKVFMGLLKQQSHLQRVGFSFLQKIYFCAGDDFLENYYAGFALGVGPDKEILVVGSQYHGNQKSPVVASLLKSSVLDRDAFKQRKISLMERGRLYETKKPRIALPDDLLDYEPPTIETPEFLLDSRADKPAKKRTGRKAGVFEIRDNT